MSTTSWLWSIIICKIIIKNKFIYIFVFILFRFESIVIGEIGDNIAVVDTDDVDDEGSILSEFWLISLGLLLSVSDSVKSGNDECWSRFICEERLLW